MRKDARIGLVLGGVILAVLAVFVMLPSSKKVDPTTATLHEEAPGEVVNVDLPEQQAPAVDPGASREGTPASDPFAGNNDPSNTSSTGGTTNWASLLDKGLTPVMVTETPSEQRPVTDVGPGPGPGVVSPDPLLATPVVRTYTVKSGDTLVAISRAEYGTSKHVDLIIKANPEVSDPRKLKIGMVLKIPPLTNPASSAAKTN